MAMGGMRSARKGALADEDTEMKDVTPRDTNKVRTALLAFYLCYKSIQWVLNPIYGNHYIVSYVYFLTPTRDIML